MGTILEKSSRLTAVHVKHAVPTELTYFLTHILLRSKPRTDEQVISAVSILDHEAVFETLQEHLWPVMEQVVGEELIPTYAYARLYQNGCSLAKHTDRPACEVSITIQLGRSHHYAWPIYMGGARYDLAEGDGIIYAGCDVEHWREPCRGPDGYYSGQVFCHYVRKNGPYAEEACDAKNRVISDTYAASYVKDRATLMITK